MADVPGARRRVFCFSAVHVRPLRWATVDEPRRDRGSGSLTTERLAYDAAPARAAYAAVCVVVRYLQVLLKAQVNGEFTAATVDSSLLMDFIGTEN